MKIAVIATVWFPLSHADVIVTRWMHPYPTDIAHGWIKPSSTIASVYLEQIPSNDIGRKICQSEGVHFSTSVREALTLGTNGLAVDAVLLIGEHGDYPLNEFGQKLYPRKRLFDEIVAVFRESQHSVPVFNDKHLSWSYEHSCEMLEVAHELGFPLYAGSSIPHSTIDPAFPVSDGEAVTEALALFHGDQDHYGFHTIEFAQSLIERRRGGETGIRAVRSFRGDAVLAAFADGSIPKDLALNALVHHGYPQTEDILSFVLDRTEDLLAYQIEHNDGLRVTHLRLQKFVTEWVVVVRTAGGEVKACHAAVGAGGADFFSNFAFLNIKVESFFRTGETPTPLLRSHLATGALEALQHALMLDNRWLETPQLHVCYKDN